MRAFLIAALPLAASNFLPPITGTSRPLPGNVVDVVAGNYYLRAPDTIPAGVTTLRLHVGQGAHIAVLVRLDSGHTATDLLRSRREGRARPSWMHYVGGPGFPPPGAATNATVILTPGSYVLMCDVEDSDGVRHFERGMFHPIAVVPSTASRKAALPAGDAVVTMRDYNFAFSRPLRAGDRALRIVNRGSVMHEFRVVHVLPGHTGKESIAWKPRDKTPRPDEDVGAVVGLMPGGQAMTTLALIAGEYVVFCVPQIAHNMIQIVRVLPTAKTR